MRLYYQLHYYGKYSNEDIDNMILYEAEFYLKMIKESMKAEKEANKVK